MHISTHDFGSDVERFLEEGMEEVREAMRQAGEQAVEYNVKNGDYHDRTGHLRASNYYEVSDEGLEVGNSADYAEDLEARGYMVCSGGALLAEELLNGK